MNNKNNNQVAPISAKKRITFYAIACMLPFLFILLFEGILRLVGFGINHQLFVTNPANKAYLLATPNVMERYFPYTQNKPSLSLETDFFLAIKPKNGFRIFVQGGSTAAGFPYGLGASIAGTLEQRLRQSMPNQHVEVVNTAMSAVNSFTLLDMADDIIAQQPDMILIYAGHNEYLGILGASSNFSMANGYWLTRCKLYLKDFRTFQLFQWLYAQFQDTDKTSNYASNENASNESTSNESTPSQTTANPDNQRFDDSRTMMAQVAQDQSILYNSPVYQSGLQQFENNLNALLNKYRAANIPVLLSSVASNYKHQPPLSSAPIEKEYQRILSALESALDSPSPGVSSKPSNQDYRGISTKFMPSQSAELHFQFAQHALKANAQDIALKHFKLAIQHDLLKFRAPKEINAIIGKMAQREGVSFVDTLGLFEERSPQNIVGNTLMLEHLHPTLQAYYLLSEAFYLQITEVLTNKVPSIKWKNIPIEKAWRQRLVLPSEEYHAYATIENLTSHYPFVNVPQELSISKPNDKPQALGLAYFQKTISWLDMMEANLAYYRDTQNQIMVLKTTQILADALPHNGLYNVQAADMLVRLNENELAVYYYKRALKAGAVDEDITNKIKILSAGKS